MKNLKLFSLFVVMASLVSCSDDDDPKNLAEEVNGHYVGYTVASCTFFNNMVSDNQEITITSVGNDKVNISYESDTWGTITISNATLSGSGNNISIAGTGKSVMTHAGNTKEYDCTAAGTVNGKELSLTLTCPQVMGGLTIDFKQGNIPATLVVPGTYSGYTEASSAYFNGMTAGDQKIEITKNEDDTFSVKYLSETWGEFAIDNAIATYTDGVFEISGNGKTKMGMDGNIKEYDCSITGTIDVSKSKPSFTFSVPAVMGGLNIVFHSGDMPS